MLKGIGVIEFCYALLILFFAFTEAVVGHNSGIPI